MERTGSAVLEDEVDATVAGEGEDGFVPGGVRGVVYGEQVGAEALAHGG